MSGTIWQTHVFHDFLAVVSSGYLSTAPQWAHLRRWMDNLIPVTPSGRIQSLFQAEKHFPISDFHRRLCLQSQSVCIPFVRLCGYFYIITS